uniref:Cathepsin propeptide inhibitor domain-containing protein n=1 Tax=Acrobeloides nanus TaxID=290746 RepID=A0A914D9C1_9BILA
MAISQLVLLVLVAWIAPSFAKIDENINYKKILDRKSFVQPIKSIHTVSPYVFWGRGRQYVLNYDSLTKLIQQNLDDWEAYKTLYNKKFDSEDLETERMLAFISAQQTVRRHNDAYDRGNVSFKLAVNSIADLVRIKLVTKNIFG